MPAPDTVGPIERRSARRAVYEHVKSWIEDGHLAPGELINDQKIAQQLGVSRTPVREALQMLEQHGAVEMLPGRQTRVTETTPDDVTLIYGPLAELEAFAAEVATPRAGNEDVKQLERHNAELLAAIKRGDAVAARAADTAFHGVLVRLAANRYLATAIEPLLMHVSRLETTYFGQLQPSRDSYREHQQIVKAVAAGDAERARELTHSNFLRYWDPHTKSIVRGSDGAAGA